MNEQKEVKKNYKKKLLSAFAVLFLAGFVFATYTVLTTVATVDVKEPFEVSYAMLGDAGDWSVENCSAVTEWLPAPESIDFAYIYAGEVRTSCVKVNNLSEADLAYGIEFDGLGTAQMEIVSEVISSPVVGQSESVSRIDLKVFDDATPAENYTIDFWVTRG